MAKRRTRLGDPAPVAALLLRLVPDDVPAVAAAEAALGLSLPRQGGRMVRGGAVGVLALAPDEWLLLPRGRDVGEPLRAALAPHHAAVIEMGDAWLALSLAGPGAAEALAAGSALDLGPAQFPAGSGAATRLGSYAVILMCEARADDGTTADKAGDAFTLLVPRSYAVAARGWLAEVIGEGAPEQP
ncbi:MAG: hypothetical protein IT557_05490 [Alphaproteobacteria bacterium]|nr:hypothetical protein [Alphaproteobacteria bacterium]